MDYQQMYEAFVQYHVRKRSGDRRRRIAQGLGHAERKFLQNVWWPAFGDFSCLHPEYEVRDFKDGTRFIDFAYITPQFRIALEIDGVQSHWRGISSDEFSDHCQRQNHLVIDGWYVLRFAYVDVEYRPRVCQQTVQQLIGKLLGQADHRWLGLGSVDREIVRLFVQSLQPLSPARVAERLGISSDTASKRLRGLARDQWLLPVSGKSRIRAYSLHPSRRHLRL